MINSQPQIPHRTGSQKLIEAIKSSRNEGRDRCLVLLMFRHGLRVSEVCGLQLEHVDTERGILWICQPMMNEQKHQHSQELQSV